MRAPQLAARTVTAVAVPMLVAGVAVPATAAAARPASRASSFTISGSLSSVAIASARSAWAVGCAGNCFSASGRTLIAHWNGSTWKRVPSPSPARGVLAGVTALSARNAWAVGCAGNCSSGSGTTLILHWNGTAWKRVPSPAIARSTLDSVAAVSATRRLGGRLRRHDAPQNPDPALERHERGSGCPARARGSRPQVRGGRLGPQRLGGRLQLHQRQPVHGRSSCGGTAPPGSGSAARLPPASNLNSVAALSSRSAWTVGLAGTGGGTWISHWNGRTWKRVSSPNPARLPLLPLRRGRHVPPAAPGPSAPTRPRPATDP